MFAALRRSRPWIARLLLLTLAVGWLSASAQVCLMGDGSDDVRLDDLHCVNSHPCCEGEEDSSAGNLTVGCQGMETLSSPLVDILAAGLEPWDLTPPPGLPERIGPFSFRPKLASLIPAFASTPGNHPSLRFRSLRI